MHKKLGREFFTQPTLKVAQEILGKFLVHEYNGQKISGKIVEVEAYIGKDDKASHAFGGKKTQRNLAEYLIGGHVYIYLVYGIHWQFNISTFLTDQPECILLRALEPVLESGLEIEDGQYEKKSGSRIKYGMTELKKIASGPGKLCRFMHLDKSFYGYDLCQRSGKLYLEDRGIKIRQAQIMKGPRIGIDYAGPYWSKVPWRFWLKDNMYVSR